VADALEQAAMYRFLRRESAKGGTVWIDVLHVTDPRKFDRIVRDAMKKERTDANSKSHTGPRAR
jgi:hypothetical protein